MAHPRLLADDLADQLDEPFGGCDHENCLALFLRINLGSSLDQKVDTVHVALYAFGRIAALDRRVEGIIELPLPYILVLEQLLQKLILAASGALFKGLVLVSQLAQHG